LGILKIVVVKQFLLYQYSLYMVGFHCTCFLLLEYDGCVFVCLCCRSISWEDAVYYYQLAIAQNDHDEGGEFDSTMEDPLHQLQAEQAALYRTGGHGLDKDLQKAGKDNHCNVMFLECLILFVGYVLSHWPH
jgi:hypothetical protein